MKQPSELASLMEFVRRLGISRFVGIMLGYLFILANPALAVVPVPPSPHVVKVQVVNKDGQYPFVCTLIKLVRTQSKVLGIFRITNVSGTELYLKPSPELAGNRDSFDFQDSYIVAEGKSYPVSKSFPSRLGFGNFAFLAKDDRVLPNSELFWIWYEKVPDHINEVDLILPRMEPFNDIRIESPKKNFQVNTEMPSVVCELQRLEITPKNIKMHLDFREMLGRPVLLWPNLLTLPSLLFGDLSSGKKGNGQGPSLEAFNPSHSILVAGGVPHEVLTSRHGKNIKPLSTSFEKGTIITGKSTLPFFINFLRPPSNAKTFTLLVPNCEPFIEIPFTGPWEHPSRPAIAESPDTEAQWQAKITRIEDLMETGRDVEALSLTQESLKAAEAQLGSEHPNIVPFLKLLGMIYYKQGKFTEAIPPWQRSLKIDSEQYGLYHEEVAIAYNNLMLAHKSLGDYEKARGLGLKALEAFEKSIGKDHELTAVCLSHLALLQFFSGSFEEGLPLAKRALEIIRSKPQADPHHLLAVVNNLASFYPTFGYVQQALSLFQEAEKILKKVTGPNSPEALRLYQNMAAVYLFMGDFDKALKKSQEALRLSEGLLGPDHRIVALHLRNLAYIYYSLGMYEKSLDLLKRSLAINEKALGENHPFTRMSHENLGFLYLTLKNYEQAKLHLAKANSIFGLVELSLSQNLPGMALATIKRFPFAWRDVPFQKALYHTQAGLAYQGLGDSRKAAEQFHLAVEVVEDLRQRVPRGKRESFFHLGFAGGNLRCYRGLVAVLVDILRKGKSLPSDLELFGPEPEVAAFYFSEATKSRALLETMAAKARGGMDSTLPFVLAQKQKLLLELLLDRLGALDAQWEENLEKGEAVVAPLRKERRKIKQEEEKLITAIRKTDPRYAALKYPQPLKPKEVPLEKDEVLLEYALGEKESYLFRVQPGGATRVFILPLGREVLEKRVGAMLAPFRNKELHEDDLQLFTLDEAVKLYRELLAPALEGVNPATHLIIVPDGVLGAFPFEALVVEAGKGWGDSVLVADRWPITYSQSAAILALNHFLKKPRAKLPLFALGDCNYDKVYPRLPQTREAVGELAALFHQPLKPPQVLLGVLATETRVKKTPLERYRYLFFGTHGVLTHKTPGLLQPVLILTHVEDDPGDDGNLTFTEVLNLKLDAELVTLAACLTGVGKVMQGEGLLHMARAFQQAGARSVMVALWKIPVKESLLFYRTFYQALKDGKSKVAAFQAARQAVRAQNPHPFFWAGLILHGEGK